MAQDLYEVLEIPDNANMLWIRRAYDLKRNAIENDASLAAAIKEAKLVMIEKAWNVLSNPDSRERYDNRHVPPASRDATTMFNIPAWIWFATALVVLIGMGIYWQNALAKEKLRIEQEKIVAEQAARERVLELQLRAQQEATRLFEMAIEKDSLNKQTYLDQAQKRFDAAQNERDRLLTRNEQRQADSQAQARERREREELQTEQRNARAEVERQKRYLEQQERERQIAGDRQRASAARDQYLQEMEERRNRVGLPPRR